MIFTLAVVLQILGIYTTCTPVDFSIVIPVSCRHEKVKVPNIPSIFWIAPFILTEPLRLPVNFSTDLMKPRHGHGVGHRRSSDFLTSKDSNHAMACLPSYGHRVLPSSNKIFVYMTTLVKLMHWPLYCPQGSVCPLNTTHSCKSFYKVHSTISKLEI